MLVEFAPRVDSRGSFTRVFCADTLAENGIFKKPIKHINHSVTVKAGTVRGLHYQKPPALEAKLFRCIRGALFDVMIDLRKDSSTFLKAFTITLDSSDRAVFVPEGFAHGFQTLEDNTEAMYMTTVPYAPEHEGAVRWDDPLFGIAWPLAATEITDRDRSIPLLSKDFIGMDVTHDN
jgi:dTDP-4-dehydrorhamnose 3,5-epimerase